MHHNKNKDYLEIAVRRTKIFVLLLSPSNVHKTLRHLNTVSVSFFAYKIPGAPKISAVACA